MHEKQNPKSWLVMDAYWSSLCACSDGFVEVCKMTDPCDNCKRPWCYDCPYEEEQTMTVYEAVKKMTKEEMQIFIYWVYMNGVKDGEDGCYDSLDGFFGESIMDESAEELMPNGVKSLWNHLEAL